MLPSISFLTARLSVWWQYLCPPVLGVMLYQIHKNSIDSLLLTSTLFLFSFLTTVILAYFFNDWADIQVDRLANKPNFVGFYDLQVRWKLAAGLWLLAVFPWYFLVQLPTGKWGLGLWMVEIIVLLLYSFPPFRFKNRHFWGAFCDTLYSSVLPIGMVLTVFGASSLSVSLEFFFGLTLLLFKGFRNIIIHQIEDRHADSRGGIHTLVLRMGTYRAVAWLNYRIIPLEVIINAVFWWLMLSNGSSYWLVIFLIFLCWTIIVFVIDFAHNYTRIRNLYNRFWYSLNNFYEGWLPFGAFLLFLQSQSLSFAWLLVWFLLFYKHILIIRYEVKYVVGTLIIISQRIILRITNLFKQHRKVSL